MKNALLALLAAVGTAACGPSLASMHEAAGRGAVQEDAPVHVKKTIEIHASREAVWKKLTDFAAWPSWQPGVKAMRAPEKVEAGESFVWTAGSSEITSTLAVVRPNETIAWTGQVSVAKAVHVFRLEAVSEEVTRVTDEESMDGFLLTWFYGQADLEADMDRSLEALRSACER